MQIARLAEGSKFNEPLLALKDEVSPSPHPTIQPQTQFKHLSNRPSQSTVTLPNSPLERDQYQAHCFLLNHQ